ncbi:type II secretion system protein GspD [Sulfuricurvum sp.]|uniref:type II secretion system protein GspD n=1 Tax=Sulfuricurvum sp. TaxID=2025608 RepID=UPI0035692412
MTKLLLIFFLSFPLFAGSLSLYDLAFFVSKSSGKSVIFSKDVDQKVKIIFSSAPVDYLPLFKQALKSNGYTLKTDKSFYYVMVPLTAQDSKSKSSDSGGIFGSFPSFNSGSSAPHGDGVLAPPPPLVSNDRSISVTQNGRPIYSASAFNSSSQSGHGSIDSNLSSIDTIDENVSFKSLTFVYLKPDDLNDTLRFSGFKYSVAKNSKTIIFSVPYKKLPLFNDFVAMLKELDFSHKQVTIKVTVFDSSANKLRDLGLSPLLSSDLNISSSAGAILTGSLVSSFYSSLHALDSKGVTAITDTPNFLLSDNETLDFKSVTNMPFLDENFAFSAVQGTNQSKKYKYKPIGFKVLITPTIVNDVVYLDFYISFESIVSGGDLPVTSEKSIHNRFALKFGDLMVLAGISKQTLTNANDSVPYLNTVPILGSIFSHDSHSKIDETFNISIEVVK